MVSNSFLCHFPSHYLLRMNFRINCLQSVCRILISSLHSWLVLPNLWMWLKHFWHFYFVITESKNKPSLREPAAGQSPFTCKQNPGLACLWLQIWQSTQDGLRKGWRGHWQGAGVFSSIGLSLAMLIVRALPYKDNHCTVKTKQPQQKLPENAAAAACVSKACFPQNLYQVS